MAAPRFNVIKTGVQKLKLYDSNVKKQDTTMNNFRQQNRAYDDMLENQYQAEIEAAENRDEFIEQILIIIN